MPKIPRNLHFKRSKKNKAASFETFRARSLDVLRRKKDTHIPFTMHAAVEILAALRAENRLSKSTRASGRIFPSMRFPCLGPPRNQRRLQTNPRSIPADSIRPGVIHDRPKVALD